MALRRFGGGKAALEPLLPFEWTPRGMDFVESRGLMPYLPGLSLASLERCHDVTGVAGGCSNSQKSLAGWTFAGNRLTAAQKPVIESTGSSLELYLVEASCSCSA